MELHSSGPHSHLNPLPHMQGVPNPDQGVRTRPPATASEQRQRDSHDDSLVLDALAEIESKRAHVEVLMEEGVLGSCLSD
jgi:hypothetical protein